MAHGEYTHIEIPADDPERATAFYRGVFGWDFGLMDSMPDYWLYQVGRIGGAVGIRDRTAPHAIRDYIAVDSVADALPKVEALGGRVIEPKTEVPGFGWFAVVHDSEGNEIGLFESAPRPAGPGS